MNMTSKCKNVKLAKFISCIFELFWLSQSRNTTKKEILNFCALALHIITILICCCCEAYFLYVPTPPFYTNEFLISKPRSTLTWPLVTQQGSTWLHDLTMRSQLLRFYSFALWPSYIFLALFFSGLNFGVQGTEEGGSDGGGGFPSLSVSTPVTAALAQFLGLQFLIFVSEVFVVKR